VLKLTYELSRHWSIVLRGGAIGGMDVSYSKRFDKFGSDTGSR
jgi:translocation and assembly module TamB